MDYQTALCFDDVQLLDDYSNVGSRKNVKLTFDYTKGSVTRTFSPIMNAAMDSIANPTFGKVMTSRDHTFIHHRYNTLDDRFADLLEISGNVGISIGLTENLHQIENGIEYVDIISIDVAAANNAYVIDRIKEVGKICDHYDVLLMVGNFSCLSFVRRLQDAKVLQLVDILKVSQGGGSVCSTRMKTGVGMPTFQAVVDLRQYLDANHPNPPMICADGGIKTSGDIMKAVGGGAEFVMLGGMLAGHDECCGQLISIDGDNYMQFRGMASEDAKASALGHTDFVEGVSKLVPYKGELESTLKAIEHGLQSGLSLCGHEHIGTFVGEGRFVRVTPNAVAEAKPHVKGIKT